MPYTTAPAALIDTYDNPIASTATPYAKQFDGGVNVVSTAGQFQSIARSRPLKLIVVGANYPILRDFFKGLDGRPFLWYGVNWITTSREFTPIGPGVWALSLSLSEFFG